MSDKGEQLVSRNWMRGDGSIVEIHGNRIESVDTTEVWRSAFPRSGTPSDCVIRLQEMGLAFSRFPAEPAIVFSGGIIEGHKVDVVHICDGHICETAPVDGQLIHKDCWFAVEPDSEASVVAILRSMEIAPGDRINLGKKIRLQLEAGSLIEVIDRTVGATAAEASELAPALSQTAIQGTLYPYQVTGAAFLRLIVSQEIGCILGDEMGLGKTLQVISLFVAMKQSGAAGMLVVCPATLLENWRREIAQFAPMLTVNIHAGPKRAGAWRDLQGTDVVITSFDTAVRDESILSSLTWSVLVVDEAQNIRNPDAQRTLSIKRLPRNASVAVTGTPVENSLSDLWSLADFALPGLLGPKGSFEAEFTDSLDDASRLAPLVAPILLRRRVKEVAKDLPPLIHIAQPLELTPQLAGEYEQERLRAIADYGPAGSLVAIQRLRILCANASKVRASPEVSGRQSPKMERLIEVLDEIFSSGEKALIFTTFHQSTDLIQAVLRDRFESAPVNFIDGRVPIEGRQKIVDEFSAAPPGALVLNPKAAGTGLNITAANHVVHFNPEWNPAVQDQATARAYRRKQHLPVTVHHLFYVGTVEEVMIGRLDFKRGLSEGAATGNQGGSDATDVLRAMSISPL